MAVYLSKFQHVYPFRWLAKSVCSSSVCLSGSLSVCIVTYLVFTRFSPNHSTLVSSGFFTLMLHSKSFGPNFHERTEPWRKMVDGKDIVSLSPFPMWYFFSFSLLLFFFPLRISSFLTFPCCFSFFYTAVFFFLSFTGFRLEVSLHPLVSISFVWPPIVSFFYFHFSLFLSSIFFRILNCLSKHWRKKLTKSIPVIQTII